ncbi:MAG: hypothetical protein B7Y80_18970 [Hyphomicrobium sp. 32-62-53]|nr:MAG: hypothetical protein B7Z29_17660 [Hyphomicrobium sp. 12-62-95]OYX97696.1 MAG: hypothetical protein B7Y80_18970 [Hyphomicrobium sp. 32-62-53]
MKRIYGLILRASLVVAGLAALVSIYDTFHRNSLKVSETFARRYSYECMSRVADEELERRAKNEYGNFNARLVGCSGTDFYGSPEELLLIRRSGIDKFIPVPKVDFRMMGIDALAAFVIWGIGSLLFGGLLVFIYRVGRWTWTGKWALEEQGKP